MARQEFHLEIEDDGQNVIDLLHPVSQLSRGAIKQAMQKGAIWIEDDKGIRRLRRVKTTLPARSTIHFYHDSAVLEQTVEKPILIDDQQAYSVWFKPAGVLSQGSRWGDHCTINRWIETHDTRQRPAFITHRLDRAASGLILIAHGKSMAATISRLFEKRDMEKIYRARVHGRFELETPLAIQQPIDGKTASTTILQASQDESGNSSLLTIRIDSGRKHQIRRHLSEAGFAIIGDRLYGIDQRGDLQLCAWSLAFDCPVEQVPRYYELPTDLAPEGLR